MATLSDQKHLDEHTNASLEQAHASDFDFHQVSTRAAGDERLKTAINAAVLRQYTARQQQLLDLPDSDKLRTLAGQIKQHTIENLDYYLEQLIGNVHKNGGKVHFARDADEANRIIAGIAKKAKCTRCIKSKSMVSEEIHLVPARSDRHGGSGDGSGRVHYPDLARPAEPFGGADRAQGQGVDRQALFGILPHALQRRSQNPDDAGAQILAR